MRGSHILRLVEFDKKLGICIDLGEYGIINPLIIVEWDYISYRIISLPINTAKKRILDF